MSCEYNRTGIMCGQCVGSIHNTDGEQRLWVKRWAHDANGRWSKRPITLKGLSSPFDISKTLWPIPRSRAMFLPEFQVEQAKALQADFTILHMIAKGAYGQVYKVQKRDTKEYFAMKVLSKAKVIAENGVSQAKQEVAIQRLIGCHPFILRCYYTWQVDKTLYILTKYIGGGELLSLVDKYEGLPENVVRIYVAEIALAIDFLHNVGVVHRDITARNVILDEDGHAVIIDFGLAKWLKYTEKTNTLCGTPLYTAPEILERKCYGREVDWWSLGVLACFMLTHQFLPGTCNDDMEPILDGDQYQPPPGTLPEGAENISPAAKDLLKRLLQPDPRQRLTSLLNLQRIALYMNHDLQSYKLKKESPFQLLEQSLTGQKMKEE